MAYWWCDKHERPLDDGGECTKCWEEEEDGNDRVAGSP